MTQSARKLPPGPSHRIERGAQMPSCWELLALALVLILLTITLYEAGALR